MTEPSLSGAEVADLLARIGFGLELLGENPMRARAFTNGARAIKKLGGDMRAALASGELAKVKGVGKGLLAVIGEVVAGHKPEVMTELEEQMPVGLFEVRRVPGLGAAKIRTLWHSLGITSLGELEYACNENRLVELKGFGAKTQTKVLEGLAALQTRVNALRQDQAQTATARITAELVAAGVQPEHLVWAGELRRGCEVIRALDLVVASEDALPAEIVAAEELPVPFHVHDGDSSAFALRVLFATGGAAHVDALQQRARELGGELTTNVLQLGGKPVVCATEDDIYAALGLVPTAPERREASVPLVLRGHAHPALITLRDLRGALHNHTVESDGIHKLCDMRAAAAQVGLEYLGISDHSQTAGYAGGLSADRLRAQIATIAVANQQPGPQDLSGVESDILADGSLDYEAELLAELDVVIASVHNRHGQDRDKMTARLCRAASDPSTDIIGHPTGRLLLGRPAVDIDIDAFLDACAASGCAVELNANPQRLDLNEQHLAMAKERGLLVSIAADAHSATAFAHLEHGISIARRAGLTAADVLNSRSVDELQAWIAARREGAGSQPPNS